MTLDTHNGSQTWNPDEDRAIPLAEATEVGVVNKTVDETPAPQLREDAPVATGEQIEPGRALALVDFSPPALGAGARLIRFAYRLGVPGTMLTAPMGKKSKTRLLATVNNTVPGNRIAGTALRAGHFLVHGAKTPIAQVDFHGAARVTPPLEAVVHSFSWLTDLEACAPREQGVPVAERILTSWLQANPKPPAKPGKGPAWNVGHTGMRLMNWLVHAPLILSGEKALRLRTLRHINETARWLDRQVHHAEDGLAEVAGWCAVIAAGLLLPDGRPRRLYGEAGLIRALGELMGDDGGVLSRSPLAQMEAIALLVRLRNCYQATRRDPPDAIERVIEMLVPPLLALTHGDGSLGSWQGAWAINGDDVSALVAASGVRARPLRDVRQWGYQRAVAQKTILLFDTAPPPMPSHARYGCASTLAFEMSHGGHRLIVNCGGAASGGGLVPVRLEQGLRATAAHSTLTIDDANSTAILINGMIGSGVSQVDIDRKTLQNENGSNATRLEASHNGYAARYGLTHRRILILRDDGTELRGEDLLLPSGRKGKRGKVGYALRFHLGPEVDVALTEDGQGAGLALPDGSYWQFRSGGGDVSIEDSLWVDGHGRPQATQQLVVQGLVSRGGGNFGWLLKKMG
ncbi:heparinase II/III family protein [Novosphingobium pentaromativorans]|uniref:Heparinase II/III-like protein n=1 Tax=Novosphingobium pentaromativorans US6-1 TaxID=1088721 RepID=G6EBU2_9SPHN|nr:heparinase II/III family protein [Novosphingobium pentaromativorans]AIT80264.1 heparinase [Novosphingobium pentaromativorans US6-1]EHJ61225.1 heparinase II/III-like protein [Novosphingobium pentaromativorans US6-1]